MKTKVFKIFASGLGAGMLVFLFVHGGFLSFQTQSVYSSQSADVALFQRIAELPLLKRIGQLMIFGFATTTPDEHIFRLIKEYGVGGVNLLKRNVHDAEQVRRLTRILQENTAAASLPQLLTAVDQEGGTVVRFPFLSELTAEKDIKNESEAFYVAQKRSMELKNLGINMNFAPVLDYVPAPHAYLYERTFATTTEAIAKFGVAMARGYESKGVIPVFKHFPGYGAVTGDPHNGNVLEQTLSISESLESFRLALVELPETPLMTAHIVYEDIDTVPATRSRKFLTDMLRNEWGYDGVIITDDIEMASAGWKEKLPVEEIVVQALEAGADMIISTYTTDVHERIIGSIAEAVAAGRISEDRLNQSVLRVWCLKSKL